jgi:hypothetical protein
VLYAIVVASVGNHSKDSNLLISSGYNLAICIVRRLAIKIKQYCCMYFKVGPGLYSLYAKDLCTLEKRRTGREREKGGSATSFYCRLM